MTLLQHLEAAGEGSRALDALVAVALKLDCKPNLPDDLQYLKAIRRDDYCAPGTYWFVQRSGMSLRTSEPVTTSLDAALALAERALPGVFWQVQHMSVIAGKRMYFAEVNPENSLNPEGYEGFAETPALALCAAILRARSAGES